MGLSNCTPILLSVALTSLFLSCHRTFKEPASLIDMKDITAADQLRSGFHGLEAKTWRWTARKFSVTLKPPPGSERSGARLEVHLFISPGQMQRLGPMTLSANAGGYPLRPETYTQPGAYTYAPNVPGAALDTDLLPVKFSFDKAVRPSPADYRELAVVITSIGLESK